MNNQTIQESAIGLPDGFTMRAPTAADAADVVALWNASEQHLGGTPHMTVKSLLHDWADPGLDVARDERLFHDADGTLVGHLFYEQNIVGNHPWIDGRTHPDYEGRGIGTAGLRWLMRRALELPADLPDDVRVSAFCGVRSDFAPCIALLDAFGFEAIRYFWRMVVALDGAELHDPIWPTGIELRPFDRERDAYALFKATDEAFEDHWGFQPPLTPTSHDEDYTSWCHWVFDEESYDPSLWFIAWDGEEIAGLSRCRLTAADDSEMGWLSQLAVRKPWRKRGLATALLSHTFREFQRRGKQRVGLAVDGANGTGALSLYERAGMRVTRETATYEKELRPGRELARL